MVYKINMFRLFLLLVAVTLVGIALGLFISRLVEIELASYIRWGCLISGWIVLICAGILED